MKNQIRKTEYVPVQSIRMYEKLGDFFLDIAKLVFAGVVLSIILEINEDKVIMLFFGGSATFIFAMLGFYMFKFKKGGI